MTKTVRNIYRSHVYINIHILVYANFLMAFILKWCNWVQVMEHVYCQDYLGKGCCSWTKLFIENQQISVIFNFLSDYIKIIKDI